MTHIAFEVTPALALHLAVGYRISDAGVPDASVSQREHAGRGYRVPNGGIYTTVGDLAAFVSFELGKSPEAVRPRAAVDDNFQRLIVASANLTGSYGLGFEAFRRGDLLGFGHSGMVTGYEAAAYFDRKAGTAVLLLRSATGGAFRGTRLCVTVLQKLAVAAK